MESNKKISIGEILQMLGIIPVALNEHLDEEIIKDIIMPMIQALGNLIITYAEVSGEDVLTLINSLSDEKDRERLLKEFEELSQIDKNLN